MQHFCHHFTTKTCPMWNGQSLSIDTVTIVMLSWIERISHKSHNRVCWIYFFEFQMIFILFSFCFKILSVFIKLLSVFIKINPNIPKTKSRGTQKSTMINLMSFLINKLCVIFFTFSACYSKKRVISDWLIPFFQSTNIKENSWAKRSICKRISFVYFYLSILCVIDTA